MPLASLFTLQWYGPAAGASVTTAAASSTAGIKGRARAQGSSSATSSVPLAKATRLRNRPATLSASATVTSALPKGRARPTATIEVNKLSQDDVTGAVLEALVEPGLTLREAMRIVLAVSAGKTDITPDGMGGATVIFRDVNDTRDTVTAVLTGSERTTITLDTD